MSAPFPLPDTDWEDTRAFWAAAAQHRLVIPRCARCQAFVWYPRARCPRCDGGSLPWTEVGGRGSLFSWTVVRRPIVRELAEEVPYVTGLVALAEDPAVRLVTRIVDCEPETLRVDAAVRVVFRPLPFRSGTREILAPCFTPA